MVSWKQFFRKNIFGVYLLSLPLGALLALIPGFLHPYQATYFEYIVGFFFSLFFGTFLSIIAPLNLMMAAFSEKGALVQVPISIIPIPDFTLTVFQLFVIALAAILISVAASFKLQTRAGYFLVLIGLAVQNYAALEFFLYSIYASGI